MDNDPQADESNPGRGSRGQRVWAVLLVLDAFFVVIFGGALAAKVYEHWQAPPAARLTTPAPRQAPPALPPAPKAEAEKVEPVAPVTETARTTPPPAAPAKAPEPVKAPPPSADAVKLPKPSLIQEAPKRRETPKPQETAKKAPPAQAPAPAPAAKEAKPDAEPRVKAVSVDFRLKAPGAKSVELAGAFLVRGGGKKSMVKHSDGIWTLTVYLTPNSYRYYFVVDGKKKLDPENPKSSKGASVVTVSQP